MIAYGDSQCTLCGMTGIKGAILAAFSGAGGGLHRSQLLGASMFRLVEFSAQNDQEKLLANARLSRHHGCVPGINPVSVSKKVHTERW